MSARSTIYFEVSRHLHEIDGYLEFKSSYWLSWLASMYEVESGVEDAENRIDHERKAEEAERLIIFDMIRSKNK
jgi:hypothetical protein